VLDPAVDQETDVTAIPGGESRSRFVPIAIATAAILGGMTLAAAAVLTTEIDVDDLLDSLRPVRIPALLLIASSTVAVLFLTGRAWARWLLALILAVGSGWVLIFMEITGPWLKAAVAVAGAWGLCAITLLASRRVTQYVESMTDHWKTAYERLVGPLQDEDDARRWLSMLDTWDNAGVLTRGDRKRVIRALTSWSVQAEPIAQDVQDRIAALALAKREHPLMSSAAKVVRRRKPTA
jgi:hypothetical protein